MMDICSAATISSRLSEKKDGTLSSSLLLRYEEYWKGAWQPIEVLDEICHYQKGPVSSHALPFATEIHLMQALARRLREVIKLETPTLLHAHSPILNAIPALWVGCREGIPAVYEMRAS